MENAENIILLMDGERCTLAEWLYTNTQAPDVDHVTEEEAEMVKNLKVGETAKFWPVDVERIA